MTQIFASAPCISDNASATHNPHPDDATMEPALRKSPNDAHTGAACADPIATPHCI